MVGSPRVDDTLCMTPEDLELLARVRIASPCPMKWSDMQGDEKKRLCGQCNLHVHKVSALTTAEAVALFRQPSGRVCALLFRRFDGTVMTKDCPSAWAVGLSEAVKRVGPATGILTGALVMLVAVVLGLATLFGDNVRAFFGEGTPGALAGEEAVTPRTPSATFTPPPAP